MGAARLAAADERINRALADAVESHAAKDPGARGILKRASASCHPESESQKKIALDTKQESAPSPSVSHGGSSASGTRPSTAIRTPQDTATSDVTRGTGSDLAQGVIQPSSSDDTGDDVAMEGENVDVRSAGYSNLSGADSRRRITTKREPREARDEQSTFTGQNVPRRMSGKTTPQRHAVAVTTQEASDGSREKTMREKHEEKKGPMYRFGSAPRAQAGSKRSAAEEYRSNSPRMLSASCKREIHVIKITM